MERYQDSQLYRIRHSTAHIMAQAVLEKFPEAKIAIGPPIEDGFYYDFDLPRPLTEEDLAEIEARMRVRSSARGTRSRGKKSAPTKRANSFMTSPTRSN